MKTNKKMKRKATPKALRKKPYDRTAKKYRRMQTIEERYKPMPITLFRQKWLKKGYDLVDVTRLCEFRLGYSGWCNDFNEPDEEIYHIQVHYRREVIGSLEIGEKEQHNFEDEYVVFISEEDFIIFRKVVKLK